MKKRFFMGLALILAFVFAGCGGAKLEEKTILPSYENVKVLGRAVVKDDMLWMVHSASGAEFTFTGTKASLVLVGDTTILGSAENQVRYAIYVNGECVEDAMMDTAEKTVTVFESETEEVCTVKIVKLSESAQSTMGVKSIVVTSKGEITPTENKERLIEFIGDSITCGYGVEDENRDHHFKTSTENAMKTYAYKTAELLDVDYSFVSFSGYGIVSGYTSNGKKVTEQLVPTYYERIGFSYGVFMNKKPSDFGWDFSLRQPDVIVVNLGTNDDSYTGGSKDKRAEYVTGYVAFLETIRKNNPDATIFCTLGIMGDRLYPSVETAVAQYQEKTGDTKVYAMKFDVQNPDDGYAADWHPTEATHKKAADKLSAYIKEVMGW